MTQTLTLDPTIPNAASRLITLLEDSRANLPFLDAELTYHKALARSFAEQRLQGERALGAWREALSQRWECEVRAQRAFSTVQRQISAYYGPHDAYLQLIAPSQACAAQTPEGLLQDVRRLEVSLELLSPAPNFAEQSRQSLRTAAEALEVAIERTSRCEVARRSVMIEQRIIASLLQQAYRRTRQLLSRHIADQVADLPADYELAA